MYVRSLVGVCVEISEPGDLSPRPNSHPVVRRSVKDGSLERVAKDWNSPEQREPPRGATHGTHAE